ncbi:metallophosphoesterase [Thalassotalea mangrovi]|uniref:metallophosphoesterase n=1 Tax=Thalassotalea mangrovi TaxID=2572245 RepID=UPI00145EB05D|nr:metallophosphoesterase [Thalassotalea mangrovi]
MSSVVFTQFSDCHLYADKSALHFGQPVYANLVRTLGDMREMKDLQFAVFTGDLSQDHSDQSYRNFNEAISESGIQVPIYWLPGNHDSIEQMQNLLVHPLLNDDKDIVLDGLRLMLLNSKSATPAGLLADTELARLQDIDKTDATLLFMHHHPRPVGYFIDRHGLQNASAFWLLLQHLPGVVGVACGHVHRAITQNADKNASAPVYCCPATSIQFDPEFDGVKALPEGPAYRTFYYDNGELSSRIVRLPVANPTI